MIYAGVKVMRDAGLEAKWGKNAKRGPVLLVKNPNSKYKHQRETWWVFDRGMQRAMTEEGIVEGFNSMTILGDMFSTKL